MHARVFRSRLINEQAWCKKKALFIYLYHVCTNKTPIETLVLHGNFGQTLLNSLYGLLN